MFFKIFYPKFSIFYRAYFFFCPTLSKLTFIKLSAFNTHAVVFLLSSSSFVSLSMTYLKMFEA